MSEIKHLYGEIGTYNEFKLIVAEGSLQGEHIIEMPDKFDEVDVAVDVNEEFFNIDNFIIGETTSVTFLEYSNPIGFSIIKSVYEELGSDAVVGFKWLVHNGLDTKDVLGDDFEINFNKYKLSFDASMMKVDIEIKRRETHNKLLTREDVSMNLFSLKDLDNEDIDPLLPIEVAYKEGSRVKSNFYYFDNLARTSTMIPQLGNFMFYFYGSEENDLGEIDEDDRGAGQAQSSIVYARPRPFLTTRTDLQSLSVEVSNMNVRGSVPSGETYDSLFHLEAWKMKGNTIIEKIQLKTSVDDVSGSDTMTIVNEEFEIGLLRTDEELHIFLVPDTQVFLNWAVLDTSWSIEVHADLSTPIRKTKMVRLQDALERIASMAVGSPITVQSSLIGQGGPYYETGVTTGSFLRGVANIFLEEEKLTTSFKSLFYDGIAPLLACGFDLVGTNLIIEGLDYFFSDDEAYDFSNKQYLTDDLLIENDLSIAYNELIMGSKKYSTDNKGDLLNYNTELKALSPLRNIKAKLDKTTDVIIDEDKIQELILDKSSATNKNDDDVVIVDLVETINYIDEGVLSNCIHSITPDGFLQLLCYTSPFDTLPLSPGGGFTITAGINMGTYNILSIDKARMVLSKNSGIVEGEAETPVSYTLNGRLKNRTKEGFLTILGVRNIESCTNLRHNPKYQLARWAPYYLSALNKKEGLSEIIVTDYKNNGGVTIEPNGAVGGSVAVRGELDGETTFKDNESLFDLRVYGSPKFSGERIEITLPEVSFEEFLDAYNAWQNTTDGRGYIYVPSPKGTLGVYPFGSGAFTFNGGYNELTIKGKVRSVVGGGDNPTSLSLLSVVSSNPGEATYTWSYDGLEGATLLLEARIEGGSWQTLGYVPIEDEVATVNSNFFNTILGGTNLDFRVSANVMDNYLVKSNSLSYTWPHGTMAVREISRIVGDVCGRSSLTFEVYGAGDVVIELNVAGDQGSYAYLYDGDGVLVGNITVGGTTQITRTHTLTGGAVRYSVVVFNTDIVNGEHVSCTDFGFGGNSYPLMAGVDITFEEDSVAFDNLAIGASSTKYSRKPLPN